MMKINLKNAGFLMIISFAIGSTIASLATNNDHSRKIYLQPDKSNLGWMNLKYVTHPLPLPFHSLHQSSSSHSQLCQKTKNWNELFTWSYQSLTKKTQQESRV